MTLKRVTFVKEILPGSFVPGPPRILPLAAWDVETLTEAASNPRVVEDCANAAAPNVQASAVL
jgi:hypothetical protein